MNQTQYMSKFRPYGAPNRHYTPIGMAKVLTGMAKHTELTIVFTVCTSTLTFWGTLVAYEVNKNLSDLLGTK